MRMRRLNPPPPSGYATALRSVAFCPVAFCLSGLLSCGLLSVAFCPVAFCSVAFCRGAGRDAPPSHRVNTTIMKILHHSLQVIIKVCSPKRSTISKQNVTKNVRSLLFMIVFCLLKQHRIATKSQNDVDHSLANRHSYAT